MELIEIAQKIESSMERLTALGGLLDEKGKRRSEAVTIYEKELAKTIIGLRNGESFNIEAWKVADPPVTILKDVAKGVVWNEKLAMDMAEVKYKNLLVEIEIEKACLLAKQSLFRNLSHL